MSTNYTWLGIYVEIIYHPWVKSILTVRDPHVKWETPWNLTHREKLLRGKSVIKLREKRAHEGGAGWAGPRPGQDGSHQKKKKEYKLVRTRILTATWRRAYTTHTTCHIWYIHTQAQLRPKRRSEWASQPEPTRWRGSNFPAPKWGLSLLPSRTISLAVSCWVLLVDYHFF